MSLDRDRDPLLVIWEAVNLLPEVNMYPDAPQIKNYSRMLKVLCD
jgi:hypothetical protein